MPLIGRQIPHFNQVDTQNIEAVFSDDNFYRYILTFNFLSNLLQDGRSKTLVVILKNPSSADRCASDATIRKVETFVYHRFPEVKKVVILNLFAIRATYAKEVQENLKINGVEYIVGSDNHNWFRKVLQEADHVICAWGGNSGIDKTTYLNRINQVKSLFSTLDSHVKIWQVKGEQKTTQPLHGLMWGYEYNLEPYKY
jgi:hypothetical protein